MKRKAFGQHLRPIFIASEEHHEGVRFPKEVLLVQLVGTELHCGHILGMRSKSSTSGCGFRVMSLNPGE